MLAKLGCFRDLKVVAGWGPPGSAKGEDDRLGLDLGPMPVRPRWGPGCVMDGDLVSIGRRVGELLQLSSPTRIPAQEFVVFCATIRRLEYIVSSRGASAMAGRLLVRSVPLGDVLIRRLCGGVAGR